METSITILNALSQCLIYKFLSNKHVETIAVSFQDDTPGLHIM